MRFRVTDIDAYEYWRCQPDPQEADFVRRLLRQEPETEAMRFGTWFHQRIEAGEVAGLPDVQAHEIPVQCEFRGWTLSGRVDAVYGNQAIDWKTTSKPCKPERYMTAWQWRLYLWLLGEAFESFAYWVFQFSMPDKQGKRDMVRRYPPLVLHRYPGMEGDILAKLDEYRDFLLRLEASGMIRLTADGPSHA